MRFAVSAIALLACTSLAHAADLGGPYGYDGSLKDAPSATAPIWTGLYVGAHAGWGQADFDFHTAVTTTPNQESDSWIGGGQIGYNLQRGNFVLGLEADVSFGDLDDTVKDGNYITQDTDVKALGSARARIGYSFGRVLPYLTGGLGWARVSAGEHCPPGALFGHCSREGAYDVEDTQTYFGWALGGGVEVALNERWSVKADYLHMDLGSEWFNLAPKASPRAPDLEIDTFKVGVNYRFSG